MSCKRENKDILLNSFFKSLNLHEPKLRLRDPQAFRIAWIWIRGLGSRLRAGRFVVECGFRFLVFT